MKKQIQGTILVLSHQYKQELHHLIFFYIFP